MVTADAAKFKQRADGVVLYTIAHREIICAPCLLGGEEGEYVIDPRGLPWVGEDEATVEKTKISFKAGLRRQFPRK